MLAYDLCRDGTLLYTNGTAVFHLNGAAAPQKICEGKLIEHVAAIN